MSTQKVRPSCALESWLFPFLVAWLLSPVGLPIPGSGPAHAADGTELKFAHFMSPAHIQHQQSFVPFTERVSQLTGGKVRIRIYPGGALGGALQTPDIIRSGIADMAFLVPAYHPGRFPRCSALDLPFLFDGAVPATRAFYSLFDPYLREDFRDYRVLWLYSSDPGQLFTTGKPLATLEDLRGLKTRSPSAAMSEALKMLGAHPVGMPISELHTALERGVLDGLLAPTTTLHDFKMTGLIRSQTRVNLFCSLLMVVMRPESYDALPDFARRAIDEAAGQTRGLRAAEIYDRLDAQTGETLRQSGRVAGNLLSFEEKRRWTDRLRSMDEAWVTLQEKRGLPAQAILAAVRQTAGQ